MYIIIVLFVLFILAVGISSIPELVIGHHLEYENISEYLSQNPEQKMNIRTIIFLHMLLFLVLILSYLNTIEPLNSFDLVFAFTIAIWGVQVVHAISELFIGISLKLPLLYIGAVSFAIHPDIRKVAFARLCLVVAAFLIWFFRS